MQSTLLIVVTKIESKVEGTDIVPVDAAALLRQTIHWILEHVVMYGIRTTMNTSRLFTNPRQTSKLTDPQSQGSVHSYEVKRLGTTLQWIAVLGTFGLLTGILGE